MENKEGEDKDRRKEVRREGWNEVRREGRNARSRGKQKEWEQEGEEEGCTDRWAIRHSDTLLE